MRIIRFVEPGSHRILHGVQRDEHTAELLEGELPSFSPTGRPVAIGRLLAPLVPTDILCIGLNYRGHAQEQGSQIPQNPMLFIKSGNALADPDEPVSLPPNSQQVDFEAELAVVIGRPAKRVSRSRALEHVFGYTIANDVSARDWQKDKALNGGQFARGKSFDRFCPLGPAIVTADEVPDPNRLGLELRLNGRTMQQSNTADMIFDVPAIIESLSSTMTLRTGAVILTGTPAGVGMARTPPVYLKPGDVTEIEIERLGTLVTRFTAE
jgi:2-keto-4-pentenoate hydratase/2-oxohepta-3-ene-1,7-dioic acid hydratase in catechol pathway